MHQGDHCNRTFCILTVLHQVRLAVQMKQEQMPYDTLPFEMEVLYCAAVLLPLRTAVLYRSRMPPWYLCATGAYITAPNR